MGDHNTSYKNIMGCAASSVIVENGVTKLDVTSSKRYRDGRTHPQVVKINFEALLGDILSTLVYLDSRITLLESSSGSTTPESSTTTEGLKTRIIACENNLRILRESIIYEE